MKGYKRPGPVARFFRGLTLWLATALQWIVHGLESLIELLGQEPDANRSSTRLLEEIGVRFMDPEQAMERGKKLEDKGSDDAALRLYVKLLEHHPDFTPAMDAAAEIMAEMGDVDGAKDLVMRSVELQPDGSYAKYILLGHLEHGRAAVAAFTTGLALLSRHSSELEERVEELDGAEAREAEEELVSVRKRMSAVMAAMAKVYLTDMFEEPEAAAECEQLLDKALRFDSENPEACQALADLRLTQGRQGEALLLARRTAEICARLPGGLVPTYDFRVVTARLLVELSAYSDAVGILEGLTGEDPEDTEAWYLLGMCRMMLHRPREARDALLTARALLEENPARNGALMSQINQLLARRVLSEQEREGFWNPRGWLGGAKGGESVRRTEAYSRAASGGVEPAGVVVLGMEPDVEDLIDLSPHGAPGVPNANGYGRLSFNGSRPASPGPVSPRPVV